MSNRQRIHRQVQQQVQQRHSRLSLKERAWQRVGVGLLVPIAVGAIVQFSAIAADRSAETKQNQPAPASPAPAPDVIDATVLSFETDQYTVRIFRRTGDLWMTLFNRQANKAEKNDVPMLVNVTNRGISFTNRGDRSTVYVVEVASDGSKDRLIIQQGDRVTYNQQVSHAPAPVASSPSPAPSAVPSPTPSPASRPAAPSLPTPAPLSTSSSDLTPRQPAVPAEPIISDSATIAMFQTAKYTVRVYDDSGEVRMNVYNRGTNQLELKASPVQSSWSGQNTTYASPAGALIYAAIVAPVGGYRLQVRQGDRVIYSELGY